MPPNDRPTPRILNAKQWVRAMLAGSEGGGSEPHQFRCDDDRLYMVKAPNNPQGVRVLGNELLGGLALDWLGIEHPATTLVEIRQDLIAASPGARYSNGQALAGGLAFGSEFWPSEPAGIAPVNSLVNRRDIAGVLVFDTWVRNHDGRQYRVRHAPQHAGSFEFVVVDQGHCFGPAWTADSLRQEIQNVTVAPELCPLKHEEVSPFVERLRSFGRDSAEHLVHQVPAQWATNEERAVLAEYLLMRASRTAEVLNGKCAK